MNGESDMKQLEARVAALEAKVGISSLNLNTTDLMSFPEIDAGMPPIVPIGGGSEGMFAWDAEKKQIGAGGVMIGRRWFAVAKSSEGLGDHAYCIEVTLKSNGQHRVSLVQQDIPPPPPNDDTSWIPLFEIEDGAVKKDWRGCFVVPAYE